MTKKILIIDDEPDMLLVVQKRLHMQGYETTVASSGAGALKAVEAEKPDLILLDIKMHGMDGYSFLKEIKSRKHDFSTPVFIVTAMSKMKDLFIEEGASEYLVKPFEINELLNKIKKYIG